MLEAVEAAKKIGKSEFTKRADELRAKLLDVQFRLKDAKFPVVIVIGGVEGAGKSETVSLLNEWMDPRWIKTNAYGAPMPSEQQRPEYWRYWRDMPAKGQIGLYLSAWYSQPLQQRVKGDENDAKFDAALEKIGRFERLLTNDGALIIKYWLHLDKDQQRKHLHALEADPATAWRIAGDAWENWHLYGEFVTATEYMIRQTDAPLAPWKIIDGAYDRYRSLAVGEHLLATLEAHLARKVEPSEVDDLPAVSAENNVLRSVDLDSRLSKSEYKQRLTAAQSRLNRLQQRAKRAGVSTLLMFEGWDAAGKGGAVRRIIHSVDPRQYSVIPIAAPTAEEHAQHYLWRFWQKLPLAGEMAIFDRSWYGRVLVERIEGFARNDEWQRAYDEINDFEQQLVDHGTVVCKFWLHISNEEQLQRFEDRAETPHKAWKLTDEDWRNRDRWDDYEQAVHDMVERSDTVPWTLIAANQKWQARVQVLEAVCAQLEARLKQV